MSIHYKANYFTEFYIYSLLFQKIRFSTKNCVIMEISVYISVLKLGGHTWRKRLA